MKKESIENPTIGILSYIKKIIENLKGVGFLYILLCMLIAGFLQAKYFLGFGIFPYFSWYQLASDASIMGIIYSPLLLLFLAFFVFPDFFLKKIKKLNLLVSIFLLLFLGIISFKIFISYTESIPFEYLRAFMTRHESVISYMNENDRVTIGSGCVRGNNDWMVLFEHGNYQYQTLIPKERILTIKNSPSQCGNIPKIQSNSQ